MSYTCQQTKSCFHVPSQHVGKFLFWMSKMEERKQFDYIFAINGSIVGIQFTGCYEPRDMSPMQNAATYVADGSFIEMLGEDGAQWRWAFENGKLRAHYAKTVWE